MQKYKYKSYAYLNKRKNVLRINREYLNLCVNLSNFSRLIDLIFFNFNSNIFFRIIRI